MKDLPKVILDTRGLLMHMLHRGTDPNAMLLDDETTCNRAAFGFENFLEGYLLPLFENGYTPLNIIAVWDGGKNYRKMIYPQYKAKRDEQKAKQDPAIGEQVSTLEDLGKRFLANLGCVNVYVDGVEADDVIKLVCDGFDDVNKMVITVDADLLQLTDEKTFVQLKDEVITDDYVLDKKSGVSVPLNLITLYKSLVGDKSDNYGGVPRVGPKAWDKLVQEYGHDGMQELEECVVNKDYTLIQEVLQNSDDKVLLQIYENRKTWELMYDLANLHPELCYGFSGRKKIEPIYYKRLPNREMVHKIMKSTGTDDLFDKLEHFLPTETLVTNGNLDEVLDEIDLLLPSTPLVAFDYETVDTLNNEKFTEALSANARARGGYVDVLSSVIAGASFTFGRNMQHTYYFPVMHCDTDNVEKSLLRAIFDECIGQEKPLCAHNASFEEQITKQCLDLELEQPWDTMIMSSYVDENEEPGLKPLAERLFRYKMETYKEVMEKAGAEDMAGVSGEEVLSYGCDDAFVSAHLAHLFHTITKIEKSFDFYHEYERATVHPLNRAFETGVKIDFDRMEKLREADAKVVEEGTAFIRSELEKYCSEENHKAALNLAKDQEDYLISRHTNDGKTKDEARKKFEEYKLKLIAGSKYVPYEEVHKEVDFKPTPAQISKVIDYLGIQLPEGYEFKSIAANRITEFLLMLDDIEMVRPDNYPEDQHLRDFGRFRLYLAQSAGDGLKHRTGSGYENFKQTCARILQRHSKIEKRGDELNFNSPNQMQELLYCKLGLPVRHRSKVQRGSNRDKLGFPGSPATDEKAINMAIAEDCPEGDWRRSVLRKIIEVKGALTKESLYYSKYPLWVHPNDGCIHPGIRNCGTVTRRPTGSNPNILQVAKGPTRTMYIPRYKDHVIVPMDFSGQELRLTGSEANDPVLIEAYTGGGSVRDSDGMLHPVIKDIHTVTACTFARNILERECKAVLDADIFTFEDGVLDYTEFREVLGADAAQLAEWGLSGNLGSVAGIIANCRKMAKVVNFLIIYGGTASTLAMGLGVPTEFAEMIMKLVFTGYPRLAPWQEETIKFAYDHGYVKTAYGNWKHVSEDIRSKDGGFRSRAERQAVNQTIQGCAADILKIVLAEAYRTRVFEETKSVLIAPVYDEIVASVPIDNVFEYTQRMSQIMNVTPPGHAIPMMAEVCLGLNWGEVEELGDNPSEKKIIAAYDKMKEVA